MVSILDIIGPIMVGPSSSHTAGACRIGLFARGLVGGQPDQAHIELHGSFARTGVGHGTDRALAGGLLGLAPDDERLRDALTLAADAGLDIEFDTVKLRGDVHPNTARLSVERLGSEVRITGSSLGAGRILVTDIDGYPVEVSGDLPTLVFGPGEAKAKLPGNKYDHVRGFDRDLTLHFPTAVAAISASDESAPLWGHSLDGEFVATSQRIRIVGDGKDEDSPPDDPAAASLVVTWSEEETISLTIHPGLSSDLRPEAEAAPEVEARVFRSIDTDKSHAAQILTLTLPNDGSTAQRMDETALPGVNYWYWAAVIYEKKDYL